MCPDSSCGGDKVELYSAATGGSPLGNHLEYTGDMPLYLYVQGVAASDDPQDVELTLDAAPRDLPRGLEVVRHVPGDGGKKGEQDAPHCLASGPR